MCSNECSPSDHVRDAAHVMPIQGQRVCTRCGLVIETQVLEDEWRPAPSVYASREWAWRRAMKALLHAMGMMDIDASSFQAPPVHTGKVPYRVLAGYAYWLRFAADLPNDFVRTASNASQAEWRRAARVYGNEEMREEDDRQLILLIERLCRRYGLSRAVASATVRAMQEPRLEACDPLHVLIASTAETLGDALAARIFKVTVEASQRYRDRHNVSTFAVSLEVEGLALKAHVERCEQYDASRVSLQRHVRSCPLCCRQAEELELAFLLYTDVD